MVNERTEALLSLASQSIKKTLEQIIDIQRGLKGKQAFLISLHLKSGICAQGFVLDITNDETTGATILLGMVVPVPPGKSVMYINLSRVEAITIHDAEDYALHIKKELPITTLDLKRRKAELEKKLGEITGSPFIVDVNIDDAITDDITLKVMATGIASIGVVMEDIVSDTIGLQAIKSSVKGLKLSVGTNPFVGLRSNRLEIVFPLQSLFSREELRSNIATLL
jgi:hypothetical protein